MHLKAVHTLLLAIVAWQICGMELRLCDDRIVFPDENNDPTFYNLTSSNISNINSSSNNSKSANISYNNSSNISSSSNINLSNTSISNSNTSSNSSNINLSDTNLSSSNITSTTESPLGNGTLEELHLPNSSTSTTELPTLDNRILVDTLPVCPPGQSLRAGRCRQSA
ncbi:AAC-rich mRNA clone AAC11 protein-like [Drosophila montana]|uniref:AAC-rich mRNA clone AAC11 protein-like n=1 Tax=Drosophila montana TaxID=40370 RepID=UPI00313AA8C6